MKNTLSGVLNHKVLIIFYEKSVSTFSNVGLYRDKKSCVTEGNHLLQRGLINIFFQDLLLRKWKDLSDEIEVECDGVDITKKLQVKTESMIYSAHNLIMKFISYII